MLSILADVALPPGVIAIVKLSNTTDEFTLEMVTNEFGVLRLPD